MLKLRLVRQRLLRRRLDLLARYHDELERANEVSEQQDSENVERSTEHWDVRVLATLGDVDVRALAEVLDALGRVERGTYGLCEECAHPIPDARLDALPATAVCVECASARAQASSLAVL